MPDSRRTAELYGSDGGGQPKKSESLRARPTPGAPRVVTTSSDHATLFLQTTVAKAASPLQRSDFEVAAREFRQVIALGQRLRQQGRGMVLPALSPHGLLALLALATLALKTFVEWRAGAESFVPAMEKAHEH